jgi:hypothetical protein
MARLLPDVLVPPEDHDGVGVERRRATRLDRPFDEGVAAFGDDVGEQLRADVGPVGDREDLQS